MMKKLAITLLFVLFLPSFVFADGDANETNGFTLYDCAGNANDIWGSKDAINVGTDFETSNPVMYGISGTGGTYCDMDGSEDFDIPNNFGLFDGSKDFSITFWINWTKVADEHTIIFFGGERQVRMRFISNNFEVFIGGVGGTLTKTWDNADSDVWKHIALRFDNSEGWEAYLDGVLIMDANATGTITSWSFDSQIGDDSFGKFMIARIDQMKIFNSTLTEGEIVNDFNYGTTEATPPSPPVSVIDLLFKNTTNDYKTVFDEGENLFGIINWTNSSGSPLSDSVGSCNMTFVDGIEETEGTNEDVNFCTDPSCDFETLTETFTFSTNNSEQTINEDLMIIKDVCKYGGTKDLELDVTCNGASGSFDITNAEMPLCPNTIQIIKDIGNLCVNSTTINVTISTIEVPYTSRKEYHEIEIDREYALLLLVDGVGITYNSTSGLWESNVTTEYYIHGSKQAFANCSHFTNSSMNNSVTQNITIVNAPPEVIFSGVQTSLGLTNASDPMTIEYASGIWSWMGSVSDDDLDHFNVSIYNSSGGLIINWTGLINNTVLETPDGMFVDWDVGNPYSLNVTAVDSVGDFTIISVNFFVNDTINPSCDFANDSQLQNTDYSFDVVCTDEFFFNLNVTCDNNFSFFRDNLNTTSYNFINQTLIGTSDVTCTARYCDAHTGELSTDWVVDVKDKKFTFKTNTLEIDTPSTLSYEILADRVKFTFEMPKTLLPNLLTKWKYTYTFTYVTEGKSYYLVNDQYEAHIVDSTSETWFDLNGIEGDITVKRLSDNTWEVKVMTDQLKLEFESVGELNCVETEFVISSSLAIITCQYDSTPFMKTNLILGNRNFIPVLCQITGGEGQVFSCTTKVMNGIYLLQANPEPLSYELLGGNNFGVFKAQPLNGASQNLLAYYTEKGLRSNKTAQIHVNCVSGSTLINFNATITPQYKDLYGVMDVAVKVQQNVVWQVAYVVGIIVVVFFVILFMGMGISFIKKELRR